MVYRITINLHILDLYPLSPKKNNTIQQLLFWTPVYKDILNSSNWLVPTESLAGADKIYWIFNCISLWMQLFCISRHKDLFNYSLLVSGQEKPQIQLEVWDRAKNLIMKSNSDRTKKKTKQNKKRGCTERDKIAFK